MEHWQGPCRSCARSGCSALTLAHRGQPVGGLCPACARDPARLRDFVAVAEAFRRGAAPDGRGDAVRLHRHEGVRGGVPLVLFACLVPGDLRVPGQGRPLPRPGAEAPDPPRTTATTPAPHRPAQGRWQRLRRRLGGE